MTVVSLHPRRAPAAQLPPGRWHGRLWVSDGPLTDTRCYRELIAEFERSRLWPVLIPHDPRFELRGEDWIDDRGRLAPAADRIDRCDPGAVLARWWNGPCCDGACLHPFGAEFPGLARRSPRRVDPFAEAGNTGTVLAMRGGCRLGLVETDRPADIPAHLGWAGMITSTDRVAELCAVLRSWEDRFGATLVVLGFDELELSVAAPPKTAARALAVAAEHRAFCLRTFTDQPATLQEVAKGLVQRRLWRFWWA